MKSDSFRLINKGVLLMCLFRLKVTLLFSLLTIIRTASAEYAGPYYNIDLRDHMQFGSFNNLPTHTIQVAIENRPCLFIAPVDGSSKPDLNYCDSNYRLTTNPNIELTRAGAIGPDGYSENENFYITDQKGWSRNDTIFSVEFDGPNSIRQISEGVYQAQIILFVHDRLKSSNPEDQYYFRKLIVRTDASKTPIDNIERVQVVQVVKDIPLKQTFFRVFVDISDRKLVLTDRDNAITKVFPIGVGSFDIRTLPGMDNFVGSMTEELKNNAEITKIPQTDENGTPVYVQIMEERTNPDYYRGRPFIGILDNNGTKYKEIGFHYQIDNDQLKRGFVSHGCIRVRDKDLYQLSMIVFRSAQSAIPVKVVNSFYTHSDLYEYTVLDHPYTKLNDSYKRIIYADKNYVSPENRASVDPSIISIQHSTSFTEVERYEWCRQNGKYSTLRYIGPWASVLGTDCLTRTKGYSGNVEPILNYMNGLTTEIPAISVHETTNTSSVVPEQPVQQQLQFAPMCDSALSVSANYYLTVTGNPLSYAEYIRLCGCDIARRRIPRNDNVGRPEYRKYCR